MKTSIAGRTLLLIALTAGLASCGSDALDSPASSNANLADLTLSAAPLDQGFQSETATYSATAGFLAAATTVTAKAEDAGATVQVNGTTVRSGAASAFLPLAEGATVIRVLVTAADGNAQQAYTVTVTRRGAASFAQQAYIKAANSGNDDAFGHAVAAGGSMLAVAAPGERNNATGVNPGDKADDSAYRSGAVYTFPESGEAGDLRAYLKASNTGILDEFGFSVALSGDTLAVGAVYEDSGAAGTSGEQTDNNTPNSGAVYVFTRSGGTWSQQAYIKASNTDGGDGFGFSVALSGDTLAVGAPYEDSGTAGTSGEQTDNNTPNSGAVYVFTRSGGTWSQQGYIKASNAEGGDGFGFSVALFEDTLAVGAPSEDSGAVAVNGDDADNGAPESGAVYVFNRSGGAWTQQAYLKTSNTGAGDGFGRSIALSGDTLAAGAPGEDGGTVGVNGDDADNGAPESGAVYVISRSGGVWSQQAYVKASNTGAADRFGWSVSLSGDTLAVGAPREDGGAFGVNGNEADDSAPESGAVYVFSRSGTAWTRQVYLKASNTGASDQFGWSVSLSGDTLAVGAVGEDSRATGIDGDETDNGGTDSGAAYVFR